MTNENLNEMREKLVKLIVLRETELENAQGLFDVAVSGGSFAAVGDALLEEAKSDIDTHKNHLDCIDALIALSRLDELTEEPSEVTRESSSEFADRIRDIAKEEGLNWNDPLGLASYTPEGGMAIDLGNITISFGNSEEVDEEVPAVDNESEAELTFKWDDDYEPEDEDESNILVGAGNVVLTHPLLGTGIAWTGSPQSIHDQLDEKLDSIMPGNTIELRIIVK